MPKVGTLSFNDPKKLVAALKKQKWEKDLEKLRERHLKSATEPKMKRWKKEQPLLSKPQDLGLLAAIYLSVGRNIYRSFRIYKKWTPSAVFRAWASDKLFHGEFQQFAGIHSRARYHEWAVDLAGSLVKEWEKRLDPLDPIDIPRALTLINLLAKALCVFPPLWPTAYEQVVRHIEVPLDSFTLRPLRCLPELADLKIKSNDSMGSVRDMEKYCKVQKAIFKSCKTAGVPALAYDLMAWDNEHPD